MEGKRKEKEKAYILWVKLSQQLMEELPLDTTQMLVQNPAT
jgi:hypothetical protein